MNIRARMLKVAENLMEDLVKSFEMTEDEWKEYSELHPAAKRENHTIIPNRKNQGGNSGSEMTDEQKKLHERMKHPKSFDDLIIVAEYTGTHPTTLDVLASKAETALEQSDISDQTYKKSFMVLTRISKNPNANEKTLRRIVNSSQAYDKVDAYSSYSRKDSLIGNAVRHPNVSEDTIYDFYEDYPRHAASNPNCPTDILEKLSSNEGDYVRFLVFENPNTKKQTREKLSKDKKVIEIYEEEMAQRPSSRL